MMKWIKMIWDSKKYIAIDFACKKIDELTPELAKLLKEKLNLSDEACKIMSIEIATLIKEYIKRQI